MDVEHIPHCQDLIAYAGIGINHEKSNLLMNSLVILQNENHFKKVFFWGIIYGTKEDYYIAYGYKNDAIKGRVFYYSHNAITWLLLPKLSPKDRAHYLSYITVTRFIGNPSYKLDVFVEDSINEKKEGSSKDSDITESAITFDNIGQESAQEVVLLQKLKEEDRLAATVKFINHEAAIVPRGYLFKKVNGRVKPNPAFQGLQPAEATTLSNYLHYRIPVQRWETNVGRRPDYNYATDFLDPIVDDIPKNSIWSFHIVQGNRVVNIRNLYWPGFTFYHQLNTKTHGFLYVGFGRRNIDLPFMT